LEVIFFKAIARQSVSFRIKRTNVEGINRKVNMSPHPHRGRFNMALCCSCGRNHAPHTASDADAHCNPKKQRPPQPFLWCATNHHTHI